MAAAVSTATFSNSIQRNSSPKRKSCKTIAPELKTRGFPDEIVARADLIHWKIDTGVHRGSMRCMLLFHCTFQAYQELDINVDPFKLGICFGLTKGQVKKCDSIFSPLNTGYQPVERNVTAMNFIPEFCERLGIATEQIDVIRDIIDRVSLRNKALAQENSRTLAAGFIKYFMVINGITIDSRLLTEVTERSLATIDAMERRIETTDNS